MNVLTGPLPAEVEGPEGLWPRNYRYSSCDGVLVVAVNDYRVVVASVVEETAEGDGGGLIGEFAAMRPPQPPGCVADSRSAKPHGDSVTASTRSSPTTSALQDEESVGNAKVERFLDGTSDR